ncbi:MAG: hypothetical protein WCO60_17285 [Verrucomicrobiota bacterium]
MESITEANLINPLPDELLVEKTASGLVIHYQSSPSVRLWTLVFGGISILLGLFLGYVFCQDSHIATSLIVALETVLFPSFFIVGGAKIILDTRFPTFIEISKSSVTIRSYPLRRNNGLVIPNEDIIDVFVLKKKVFMPRNKGSRSGGGYETCYYPQINYTINKPHGMLGSQRRSKSISVYGAGSGVFKETNFIADSIISELSKNGFNLS